METQPHITTIPMQQVLPETAVLQQSGVVERRTFNMSAVIVLATIQIIIGSLTAAFSILVLILPKEQGSFAAMILSFSGIIGIAVGPIMCCGGYAGLSSYKDSQSRSKNGCHMACSILACLASGVGIGFFSAAVVETDEDHTIKAFSRVLLFLVVTELIIALASAIYTCVFACCGPNGCCKSYQRGTIVFSGSQPYIVSGANRQDVMVPVDPPGSLLQYFSSEGNHSNQVFFSETGGDSQVASSTTNFTNQVFTTQASTEKAVQVATCITYSGQGPPPPYQEQSGDAS